MPLIIKKENENENEVINIPLLCQESRDYLANYQQEFERTENVLSNTLTPLG